ncbi:leukotriene C4 synthase isoform X2 [Mustela lutreola]|uniref:leukotriene C4 synthase isoform X2 n=1 Tax=Mustela lutreola TaxID=9666 RepID=UPI002796FE49|nr:leukotriene C4 synthase isoform X2 [Mustela lutreola]
MTTARARPVGPGGGRGRSSVFPAPGHRSRPACGHGRNRSHKATARGLVARQGLCRRLHLFLSLNFSRLPKEKLAFYTQVTEVVASLDTAKELEHHHCSVSTLLATESELATASESAHVWRPASHLVLHLSLPRQERMCVMTCGPWTSSGSGKSPEALERERTSAHPVYFSLQVISARRAFRVSPPLTTGPPEFERVYRAQVNCSEYFPLFLATLWVAGIFFHEGTAALCGLVYLFARLRYFQGYARSAQQRLTPLYASARALWLLLALAALGLLVHFLPRALQTALLGRLGKLLPRA